MNESELARRAGVVAGEFAARLPEDTLAGLRLMADGGEYGELAVELTATLVKTGATVSAPELCELRALLEATGMPTHLLERLAVGD